MDDFLEIINKRGNGALGEKMGIEILEATPERLVARMPVAGNTQPIGLLHGGANIVLAESLGSIGTQLHAGENRRIVGLDVTLLIISLLDPDMSLQQQRRFLWERQYVPTT